MQFFDRFQVDLEYLICFAIVSSSKTSTLIREYQNLIILRNAGDINAFSFYENLIWAFRISKHKLSVETIHPRLGYWGYQQNF